MSDNQYDEIAAILREAQRRYGENAFDNTRRLKGLLADHLLDKANEINIVISAIEDGIPAELKRSDPRECDITISRMTERLEANRGVRGEIARSAVMAIAYGMNLSDLPSSQVRSISQRSVPMPEPAVATPPVPKEAATEWVGLSEAASAPADRVQSTTTSSNQPKAAALGEALTGLKKPQKTWVWAGVAGVVAVVAYMGTQTGQEPTPQPQQPPGGQQQPPQAPTGQQPQQPQQPQAPTGQQPTAQPPQQPPTSQQPQAGQQQGMQDFYLSDDFGLVWQVSASQSNSATGAYVLIAQSPNGPVQMYAQMLQEGGFNMTLTMNGSTLAQGQAWVKDQTHFSYQLQEGNGNITTGTLHFNHMPS